MFINPLARFAAGGRAYVLIGVALAIFILLMLLDLARRREWVKRNLPENCAKYASIRWAPFAPGWGVYWHPAFRVIYVDVERRVHRVYCRPVNITWHPRLVWMKDELIGEQIPPASR